MQVDHFGSCRVFYDEGVCTCGAVKDLLAVIAENVTCDFLADGGEVCGQTVEPMCRSCRVLAAAKVLR